MKKISFVITDLSNGGAERVVSILANYFSDKNYIIKIVALHSSEISYPLNKNIEFKYLNTGNDRLLKPFLRLIKLRKEIKDADIIISFLWFINVYTLASSLFSKKKVIISDRSDPSNELNGNKFFELIRNVFYRMPSKIVFQTSDARKYYSKKIQKKGTIIPNPISPNLPKWNNSTNDKIIISVCRLAEQKNIKMTIDAFVRFSEHFPDYELYIYGEGELRGELEKYISDLGMEGKVYFPGYDKNVLNKLAHASIYVSSSNYEGISNSMLEALGIGIPTIVTDCPVGGAKMFIDHEKNGLLVNVGNTDQLYKGLVRIAENQSFANELSINALKINKVLSQDNICKMWERII